MRLSDKIRSLDQKPGVQTKADRLADQVRILENHREDLLSALRELMAAEGGEPQQGNIENQAAWDYAANVIGNVQGCVTPRDGYAYKRATARGFTYAKGPHEH